MAKVRQQEKEGYSQLRNTVNRDTYHMIKTQRRDEAQSTWGVLHQAMKGLKTFSKNSE